MSKLRNITPLKRVAPVGYCAVAKPIAQMLYDAGLDIVICGSNVNHLHVLEGWRLGACARKRLNYTFAQLCNDFLWHLEPELGKYPVFYVAIAALQSFCFAHDIQLHPCK